MKRKKWTTRQLVHAWEQSNGLCWRCVAEGRPAEITSPSGKKAEYGTDWHMGHVGAAHWAGGSEYAPEHKSCNMEDAATQTALAAKSIRIRARANNIQVRPKQKVASRPKVKRKATAWWTKIRDGE